MLNFKRNAAIYLLANLSVSMIPFLLMPILTRYLGPRGYGIVAMFTTLITMLSPVIGLNVHNGLSKRWFDRDEFNIPEYVTACLIILLLSALGVCCLFFGLAPLLSSKFSLPFFWLFMALLVAVFAFIIQIRLVLWQVQEQPLKYASMQCSLAIVNAVFSYFLIVTMQKNFEGRLWGYVLSALLVGFWSLFLLYKEGFIRFKIRGSYLKDALAFGAPLIPHVVGAFFLLMADRLIVNIQLGSRSAGIYMVAVQIALGFNLLNESFNKAFIPKLYALLKKDLWCDKINIVKYTYAYFIFLLLVPIVSLFLSHYVVLLLAGPQFEEAVPVLNWLILTQSFHGMYYLVTSYLFYECKTYITSLITITCGSISLLLTLYGVKQLGLVGAGIGSALGMLLQFILTWVMAAKIHPMPWFFQKSSIDLEKVVND